MRDADAPAPVEDAPKAQSEGIGPALRAARTSRGVSLEQVSERLRIEPRALLALEQERFEAVGAPVFVKGYLKHYCDYLGLDTARLLAVYRAEHGADEPPVQAHRSITSEEQRPAVSMWMAATAAVTLLAAVLWLLREPAENAPAQAVVGTDTEVPAVIGADPEAPAVFGSDTEAPAVFGSDTEAPSVFGAGSQAPEPAPAFAPASLRPSPPQAERSMPAAAAEAAEAESQRVPGPGAPQQAATPAAETTAAEATAAEATAAEGSATAVPTTPAPASAGEVDISLNFVEDSWAEVVDARDVRLFYGLGRAGASARFNAAPPVDVRFGNADGVVLEVDGVPYPYPAGSRRGRIAQFTLSTPPE